MKIKCKSIFVSDTHIGAAYSNPEFFHKFLKTIEAENIFLVGDIFDFWAMKRKVVWNKHSNNVIQKFLKLSKHSKLFYIIGNHDEAIRRILPISLFNIEITNEYIHTLANGKKLLVIHGDLFDYTITHLKFLAKIGSILYDLIIKINRFIHWIQTTFHLPYWSLSKFAKEKTKEAISFIRNFEDVMINYKNAKDCDIVLCGHIHTPKMSKEYINCGDWIENFSFIIENYDGSLELKYFRN
jgi:UDP-2,3-diacylglucosamine pyrophosphatase LpxH